MPRVVTIRGTSGSGKTYVAQQVLARLSGYGFGSTLPLGPKQKIGGYAWIDPPLAVLGRYETACGGCDGLSWKGAADDIERLAADQLTAGRHVFLEGLMVSTWGADRLLRLDALASGGLYVLHLTTPIEVCLEGVRRRRAERAAEKGREPAELNEVNTRTKHAGLLTHTKNQLRKGVRVEQLDRAGALARTKELLEL